MQQSELAGDLVQISTIPAEGTAGTADSFTVMRVQRAIKITAAYWIPNAAVTGAATNNFALGVVNKGAAGSGTTTVTTVKTYGNGTNSAANVGETYTLSSTATDLQAAAGDIIALARTVNGTGLASPSGSLVLHYQYR